MQMPHRRNDILKLLSIIYTLVFMKVLSPCQIAGFDVIGGEWGGDKMILDLGKRWSQLELDLGAMTEPAAQCLGLLS